MKKAIVLLARENLPFKICMYLLNNEYEVFAIDEKQFEKEEYEEKWLSIGRNAHIHFHAMDQELKMKNHEKHLVLFIPLHLYEMYNNDVANENVLEFLKTFVKNQSKVKIIMMYPQYLSVQNKVFYKKLETIIQNRTCMRVVTNKN